MQNTSENLIVFQQDCELIKKDEADYKDRRLMSLNLQMININGETYSGSKV